MKLSPRRFFLAALAVYLIWVAFLAGLALTTSTRPATRITPTEFKDGGDGAADGPAPARTS